MNRTLQRTIFRGCRDLNISDEDRRDLQLAVTGKASLTEMTKDELKKVIARLVRDGFQGAKPGSKRRQKHQKAPRADLRLIHVLWRKLGEADQLKRPDRAGLNAFIRARFGNSWGSVPADVDMLRDWVQIDDVIRALKAWGARAEIDFDWEDHIK